MRYLRYALCFLLLGMPVLFTAGAASAQVAVSVTIAPPELPVYEQPVCPGDGYIWTPGYWAWDGEDYYWVPGTWVLAPQVGYFWTPPYWGWGGSAFFSTQGIGDRWWASTVESTMGLVISDMASQADAGKAATFSITARCGTWTLT